MKGNAREIVKRNWFFLILLLGIAVVLAKRYTYLSVDIVSKPDSQIAFGTGDGVLEQTWQPEAKVLSGVSVPYYAENEFSCDVQLKIYSDDYSRILVEETKENFVFSAGTEGTIDFSFHRTALIQGERYRIQICLSNAAADGKLQIAAGSSYGGCSISGVKTDQAAALTLGFAKYSRLFWLAAVLFPLLGYSLLMMVLTGRKWEETVGVSLFVEGIVLYGFGLLEHLTWGLGAVYLLAAVSLILAVYFYNKKKLALKDLLSPGLWIYFILFVVIIIVNNGDWLGYRDELRHWGIAVRDMFYYDSFAKHMNTTVILPRYLPFTALIEYVFVYMNGLFSEDILLIAYQTMLLSVLITLCRPLQKKCGRKLLVPIVIVMTGVPVIFFNQVSNSIMVDSLLAAITAYILICYYSEEMNGFNRIRIISALVVLTLIKDMGLVFAGLAALVMFGDLLIAQIREKKLKLRELLWPVMYVVIILMVYFSWQFYLSLPVRNTNQAADSETASSVSLEEPEASNTGEGAADSETAEISTALSASGISVDGLFKVLTGEGEEYQYQVTRNFLIELFEGDTYGFGLFTVSFVELLAIAAFLIISLGYFGYWQMDKNRMYGFAALIFAAGFCLCAFLQVTYWFSFSRYDALDLTSFDRYLAPWGCAVLIASLYLVYDGMQYVRHDSRKLNYLILAISAFLLISVPVEGIVIEGKDIEGNTTEEITYGHDTLREILRSVARRGERVYFVCSNSDGYTEYVFRNAVCPIVSEHENWNIVSTQEVYEEQYALYGRENIDDNAANVLPLEEWKAELRNCQYVVVFHADELFARSYGEVFGGEEAIGDGCVYQVLQSGNDISLELIGQTGIKGWH